MMRKYLLWPMAVLLVGGCVTRPTKVNEHHAAGTIGPVVTGAPDAIVIGPTTCVLDVREPFLFATGHIPDSINVQWSDFSQGGKFKGVLSSDTDALARRLARLGIGPQTEVVIVGAGLKGAGEEGRLAWTLNYLGLTRVRVAAIDYFAARITTKESAPVANVQLWDPQLQPQIQVTRSELTPEVSPATDLEDAPSPLAKLSRLMIDVRSEREYLGLDHSPKAPDLGAINMEWKHFFTAEGRPNPKMVEELKALGAGPDQRILVIDDNGVRAGAVAWALQQLGFHNAGAYPGGWEEFMANIPKMQKKSKRPPNRGH